MTKHSFSNPQWQGMAVSN